MAWIKYSYDCRFDLNGGKSICDTPNIEVEVSCENKSFKVFGLIDSGCQITHIDVEVAKQLGIDLSSCKEIGVAGVIKGAKSKGYFSKIYIKLKDHGDKFESPAIITDMPIPLLLGQNNFFDKFKVKFEKSKGTFELSRVD
jgi:hypothetical protein